MKLIILISIIILSFSVTLFAAETKSSEKVLDEYEKDINHFKVLVSDFKKAKSNWIANLKIEVKECPEDFDSSAKEGLCSDIKERVRKDKNELEKSRVVIHKAYGDLSEKGQACWKSVKEGSVKLKKRHNLLEQKHNNIEIENNWHQETDLSAAEDLVRSMSKKKSEFKF